MPYSGRTPAREDKEVAWQRGTVRIKFPASPGRGQHEDLYEEHPGHVNPDHGLSARKTWGGWQIDSPEGYQVLHFIRTLRDAKLIADTIAPLAPYGWTAEGTRRAAGEDKEWGYKIKQAASDVVGYRIK
jgi:hypothetical protein